MVIFIHASPARAGTPFLHHPTTPRENPALGFQVSGHRCPPESGSRPPVLRSAVFHGRWAGCGPQIRRSALQKSTEQSQNVYEKKGQVQKVCQRKPPILRSAVFYGRWAGRGPQIRQRSALPKSTEQSQNVYENKAQDQNVREFKPKPARGGVGLALPVRRKGAACRPP